ncbi:oligopeptide/dipeptide ABC transporter ATP-binding protein, partial [Proteus mirabilis]|uniref:oligopeptide/dipeptide ABC transporter ATP-binding protein n=1 Tax=Proteus mirabilis TaxID=584 RepID=UPI0034D2989C
YTRGLIGATPSATRLKRGRLVEIAGSVPGLDALPPGCAFANRCPQAIGRCRTQQPRLVDQGGGRSVACFVADKEGQRHVALVGA